MFRAILKEKKDRRIARGHLWAYRAEFDNLPEIPDGGVVDIFTKRGKFIARGFFQSEGTIAVRVLDNHQTTIDAEFFRSRIDRALRLRQTMFPGETAYRWIHAESDGLPGLTVDRYDSVVSARSVCAFYAAHGQVLCDGFAACDGVEAVRLEAAGQAFTVGGPPDECRVELDGTTLNFALKTGQKTGLYLDQRKNAAFLDAIVNGARVFDGYCYVGHWSCRAAINGAASVRGVDSSRPAIDYANANAEANGVRERCRFEVADVQKALADGQTYDVICLDPPALAKSRHQLKKSLTLYQALNRDAMKAVDPAGGYLITSTCSHLVSEDDFLEALKRAARSAQRTVTILRKAGPPPDHPWLLTMPETRYLTCVMLAIA